jgi:hypothetical protein
VFFASEWVDAEVQPHPGSIRAKGTTRRNPLVEGDLSISVAPPIFLLTLDYSIGNVNG